MPLLQEVEDQTPEPIFAGKSASALPCCLAALLPCCLAASLACGGQSHAHGAAWFENRTFDWTRNAGPLASISALGRYLWGELGEGQKLTWGARRTYVNSEGGDKGPAGVSRSC